MKGVFFCTRSLKLVRRIQVGMYEVYPPNESFGLVVFICELIVQLILFGVFWYSISIFTIFFVTHIVFINI